MTSLDVTASPTPTDTQQERATPSVASTIELDHVSVLDRKIEGVAGHCHRFEYQSADRDGERTKFVRWQTSMYMLLWPYRIAKGVLGTFLFDRVPTSADVLRFIFGTTMLMLVRKAAGADGGEYEINAHNCKVRMARGEYQQELRSWSARFSLPATVDARKGFLDVAAGSMIEFIINGTRTSNPQRMLAVLHTYYCSALHPKLHVMAEAIMRKIEVDNITELYPSLEITRGLHDTLLHSEWSPIGSVMTMLNFFPVTKASLLTESLNWTDFTHTGIFLFKDTIPFAKFLWAARNACIKHTRHLGLDTMHAEYLFIHSVGHSVDHYCSAKLTKHLRFPIFIEDENTTNWADLVGSACARYNFMAPTLNPLRSNLLKTFPPESVYGKIYRDISAVNQEWADVATASIISTH